MKYLSLIFLLAMTTDVSAQTADLSHARGILNWQISEDAWWIQRNVPDDTSPVIKPATFLFLPDRDTLWNYRNPSTRAIVSGTRRLTNDLQLDLKMRANQMSGLKLDQLSLNYDYSPSWGFRMGVVDYRMTWCTTYETDNPWIYAPTLACSEQKINESSGGSPGLQSVINLEYSDRYRVQALWGIYSPLAFNYATKDFGQFIPSDNYQVKKNNKMGFSFNVLDDYTATEYRLSWVRAWQQAYSPEPDLLFYTDQEIDIVYAAVRFMLTDALTVQLENTLRKMENRCVNTSMPSCGDAVADRAMTPSFALYYQMTPSDVVAGSYSRYHIHACGDFFDETHTAVALSWRHNWDKNWLTQLQIQRSHQQFSYSDLIPDIAGTYPSAGLAIGASVGYRFDQ